MLLVVEVGVLGPVEAWRADEPVALGARKQRALLAALALSGGHAVPVDTIVDLLWRDAPPPAVGATLQTYVAGLRRALEPQRERRAPATVLVTVGAGYALRVPADALDATRFERLVVAQHHRLPNEVSAGGLEEVAARLDEALALWRGEPYAELDDAPAAVAERTRLGELRLLALEDRAAAGLARGHHSTVAADLEALTAAHPLRERLWALRAVALTRAHRQADALEVLREVRELLADELGLEPGAELRDLQSAILRQDPSLEWLPPVQSGAPVGHDAPPPAAPPPAAPPPSAAAPPAWPMTGRASELAALTGLLEAASGGRPVFASVTGDPGIGKTRLVSEVVARAGERGFTVLTGRCSQDDGAPPLWPWRPVLDGLGHQPTTTGADGHEDEGAQFRSWEAVVDAVRRTAQERDLLVALDDLHWADRSSLRVLRLLVETVQEGRLVVVATWRAHPPPTDELADVAESLARRHALRLSLTGLTAPDAAELVAAVARSRPSHGQAEALTARTDGNPFFLVEYARLASEGDDLAALLAEPDPPTAVHDVLVRRIQRLPERTGALLKVASVVGRDFDTDTVAAAAGASEDAVLDLLEDAAAAGLVREEDVDRWSFAHALVRDTVYTALPASRRARMHARVAQALDELAGGRETERARHWLAAGPSYAAHAWPAAAAAAAATRRLHAHDDSAELLVAALAVQPMDPAATDLDRWELLMQLVDALRWAGRWEALIGVEMEAVTLAERLADDERLAVAASAMTLGLWPSAPFGDTNEAVVHALRRCLDRLPERDSRARCLVLLSLANELYFQAPVTQRRAWIDEGLAMAARLGDAGLCIDALLVAEISLFSASTAHQRLAWLTLAAERAEAGGDDRRLVLASTLRSVVEGELGRLPQLRAALAVAQREATRLRHQYALMILEAIEVPWLAMAGRVEECDERLARMQRLMGLMGNSEGEHILTEVSLALWRGRGLDVVEDLTEAVQAGLPLSAVALVCLVRAGEVEQARSFAQQHPVDVEHDTWLSPLVWACAAEAALALGDAGLAGRVHELMGPYAGRVACAGAHCAMGPVDAFLALAAAAAGDLGAAARHADRALELVQEWEIPLVDRWLHGLREAHGF